MFLVQKNTVEKVHKYITPKIERIFIKTKGVLIFREDWLKLVWLKKTCFYKINMFPRLCSKMDADCFFRMFLKVFLFTLT